MKPASSSIPTTLRYAVNFVAVNRHLGPNCANPQLVFVSRRGPALHPVPPKSKKTGPWTGHWAGRKKRRAPALPRGAVRSRDFLRGPACARANTTPNERGFVAGRPVSIITHPTNFSQSGQVLSLHFLPHPGTQFQDFPRKALPCWQS